MPSLMKNTSEKAGLSSKNWNQILKKLISQFKETMYAYIFLKIIRIPIFRCIKLRRSARWSKIAILDTDFK